MFGLLLAHVVESWCLFENSMMYNDVLLVRIMKVFMSSIFLTTLKLELEDDPGFLLAPTFQGTSTELFNFRVVNPKFHHLFQPSMSRLLPRLPTSQAHPWPRSNPSR